MIEYKIDYSHLISIDEYEQCRRESKAFVKKFGTDVDSLEEIKSDLMKSLAVLDIRINLIKQEN